MTALLLGGCGETVSSSSAIPSTASSAISSTASSAISSTASSVISTKDDSPRGEILSVDDPSSEPITEPEPAPDPDAPLRDLIASMTLEQKIAQMTMPAFNIWDAEVEACFKELQPGGVILFAKNCQDPESLTTLTSTLHENALESEHNIPLLIAIDQEGGIVTRIKFEREYPGAAEIAETGDPGKAYENGLLIGKELVKYGIDVDFAPVMDVNSNPDNPVIGSRSFSDNADTVSEFGVQMLNGLADSGVIGCLKHFPGHGDTSTDSHTGLPRVDKTLDELRELELIPFKAGIDAGAKMIMTAHIEFPNIESDTFRPIYSSNSEERHTLPATLSKTLLTDVLRGELGFEGVIITDSLEMKAIASNILLYDATVLSVNAGADLMLIPVRITDSKSIDAYRTYIKVIADRIRAGEITESRIDESVLRILKLKGLK